MKFLKFLGARSFGLRTAATEFLNFMPALRNGFEILKFVPELSNRFEILKFTRASVPFADTAQNFISQRGFKILKPVCELPFAPRRVLPRVDSAKAGRAEKFSKFGLKSALLNFISLPPRKFKPALLKFSPAPSRNGFEILNFTPKLSDGFEILKFTLAPHKFKPAPAVRLNFALNSIPPASASKFENGVKFKGAAKFERSAR